MSLLRSLHALLDRLAAAGSLLCALHCLALPLVLVAAPALALGVWWSEGLERATVAVVTLVGLGSLGSGWWRHRSWLALALLGPGLLVMWAALLVPGLHASVAGHAVAMAVGGVLVALAHLCNLRLARGHVHGPGCTGVPGAC